MSAYPIEILVYKYQKASDGFGGYLPAAPLAQANAPSWAKITPISGDDLVLNERWATLNRYEIEVNYRDDFTWSRDMFIVTTEYGVLDIEGIFETVRKRKLELTGVYVSGVDNTGSGTPSGDGLTVLYYTVENDGSTISLPALAGKTLYLFFRDGVEKTIVGTDPQVNEVAVDEDGVVTLVSGDIFYQSERITVLYI